jgi:hypothetical protein
MLDLAKATTFFASLLSLYWTALSAFFLPGLHWQDRLLLALARLSLTAALCLFSALIFGLPTRTHPDAHLPLTSTLPLQLFFWAAPILALLFLASWYLTCGAPTFTTPTPPAANNPTLPWLF